MVKQETSSENCTLICQLLQSLQEFKVDDTKKYAQLILNFFWVVYMLWPIFLESKFYKVAFTIEIHLILWCEIQTTYVYDVISL